MKNLKPREGFKNRHIDPLPDYDCVIEIVHNDIDGEHICKCNWKPFNKNNYQDHLMPGEEYLGTASVVEGRSLGIGFHAWEVNNSEFVYYNILRDHEVSSEDNKDFKANVGPFSNLKKSVTEGFLKNMTILYNLLIKTIRK